MQGVDANMQSSQESDSWHGWSASQWENCGRGVLWMSRKTVVREKWFVDRSPHGAAPAKAGGMRCPAGLRVPVPGWINGWVPPDAFRRSHLLQVPRNSSPKIGFDRALPRSRGSENGRQTREIEPAKPKPREGVHAAHGPLCQPSTHTHPHNTRTEATHTHRSLLVQVGDAECLPNPLSEHGLTNTSSNESHHQDHDHATMSLLFIFNNLSPIEHIPTLSFLVSSSPRVSGLELPELAGCIGVGQLKMRWLSQVRPHVSCVRACVRASLFHLESAGPWIHSLSLYAIFPFDHHAT